MSYGGGIPRIPGVGGGGRKPRIRDPRIAARSAVSRNPLVRAWSRLRSNRLLRRMTSRGKVGGEKSTQAAKADAAPGVETSTAVAPSQGQTPSQGTPSVERPDTPAAPLTRGPAAHHRPGPGATRSQRRAARRAARRAVPRSSRAERRRRRRADGVLWRSLLEVGRAQWGTDFDTRGLDPRFFTAFDRQVRVLVTVPRPDGGRRRVLGYVEVEGFAPEGEAVVSIDPTEGRLAVRPEFRIRSATLSGPVPVTADMRIEGFEEPNGRFRVRTAGADASA